jgi:hypothetical protein
MSNYLWKVTAIRNNISVVKGMSAEIMKTGTSIKPGHKEIAEALSRQYGKSIHDGHCSPSNFDFIQMNK